MNPDTSEEAGKFFEDAQRLAEDVSQNQTFYTVKPLLNFWGAFTPSEESGIGVGGVPKKTPYGLYRDGTELRAVYYDKPEVAHAACDSMEEQCDFPILLGNDPLYGGLGGEFTVITSSILNGPLVLRHELGHSIIDVGEEYDGGFAYFGVNAAHNASEPVPWDHWLSEIPEDDDGGDDDDDVDVDDEGEGEDGFNDEPDIFQAYRVERSVMPMQVYPWTLLNTTGSWSIKFNSSGTYSRHLVRFSLSGMPEAADLRVELDGIDLNWVPKEGLGLDRWHYDIHRDGGLSGGEHELKFTLLSKEREGVAQLCSAEILEFGDEKQFISTPGHYSLYPTFSDKNETSYRPTNEDCLMRVVTSPNFCKVCTEGLWLSLMKRVDLVDRLTESCCHSTESGATWLRSLNLDLIPLAHLRQAPEGDEDILEPPNNEMYSITWIKDDEVLEEFQDETSIILPDEAGVGNYTILVRFSTDEVMVDEDMVMTSQWEYEVTSLCQDTIYPLSSMQQTIVVNTLDD
ncbi:hypothetical protein D9756_004955 [Leucocoprinus leucothites]|uniref:Uncharacterized protein n=1 Tax=Leucocoprinus leucothites TaxID=201217 RepID=A0A8H5LK38_9AGAR|nr:hypothetical protein D9756_004955 [Leucoagaricus leucothites]